MAFQNRNWLWLIPLLTFWLGARSLDADSIWYDEYFSIYDAGGVDGGALTLPDLWARLAERNPWHAPGFFTLLNGWGKLVSFEPPALRAFALLAGVLAVAMTYRLGRDLVSARVGVYAAAVLGTSAFFVHYLHELRMYTLVALLTAVMLWLYLRIMSSPPTSLQRNGEGSKGRGLLLWLGLLASATGLLYTHFFAMLPLAAVGVYHLALLAGYIMRRGRLKTRPYPQDFLVRWRRVTAILTLAGALFLPWVNVLLTGVQKVVEDSDLHAKALTSPETLEHLMWFFSSGAPLALTVMVFGLLPVAPRRGVKQVWFFPLCILALILVVNAVLSVMHEGRVRYLLMLWCLLALVVGVGIAKIETLTRSVGVRRTSPLQRMRNFTALALLGVWMGAGVWNSMHDDFSATLDGHAYIFPIHRLARELPGRVYPGDLLLAYIPRDGTAVESYPRLRRFYFRGLGIDSVFAKPSGDAAQAQSDVQTARAAIGGRQRFWFAAMPNHDAQSLSAIEYGLAQGYQQCGVAASQPDLYLSLYAQTPICCAQSDSPPLARYTVPGAGEVLLLASDPLPAQVSDRLAVALMWGLSDDAPLNTYSVGLKVLDAAGQAVAQADYGLLPEVFTCQTTDIALDAAPGSYTLAAMVYDWQTGARLPVGAGDYAVIGSFTHE